MRGLLAKILGNKGERLAARTLKDAGFRILERQYKTPLGEIDVICLDGNCVVFVEVKTRRSDAAGHPTEAVTPAKQKKLTQMALAYLKKHGLLECRARFDVIAILWPDNKEDAVVQHYRDAFPAVGSGQMFA